MSELHDLTLLEQAAAIRSRKVSPVELVEHYLDRIDRLSDQVGAFVHVAPEQARGAAKEAERAVVDGTDLPPLHGVPTAIKDLYLTADMPTGFGSGAIPAVELGIDEAFVTKLRAAGTISLGKTNTPEFGAPCYTEPDNAPPARTPWDLERSAGGSSGGAATAVASGLLPAAPRSDGGGSIRIPSSVNGLFGIKTSLGRVSTAPLNSEISGLSVHGPIARTVRDAAALLDAMAGPSTMDWIWHGAPLSGSFLAACDDEPRGLRIGRYVTPAVPGAEVHPDCVAAYEHASSLLASLGHHVEEHETHFDDDLIPLFENLWSVEFASLPIPEELESGLRPLTQWLRERGRKLSALDVYKALGTLRTTARTELDRSSMYDAVLTPTLALPPRKVGELRNDADPAQDFDNQKRFTPFTAPYNMSGQPAVSIPLHWNDDGLPIGVQLIGRPGDEVTLLRLAAQVEAAEPWAHRKPSLW
jgi:amidase